jgi:hypothetical protein
MDYRRRNVGRHAEPSLLAPAFNSGRELALDRERYVLQRSNQHKRLGRDHHNAVRICGQRISQVDDLLKIDVIDIDSVSRSARP